METLQSILIIVTSFSEMAPGEPTGLWLEEFAVPYTEFRKAGYPVTVASIRGGEAPIDPRSNPTPAQKALWSDAIEALKNTQPVSSIKPTDYDAVLLPGGHGTMFDFPKNKDLHQALRRFAQQDKVIASMCHGPASLVGVTLDDGTPLVAGKTLTSFTNEEELEAGFKEAMPFLLETRLRELGAKFIAQPNWSDHVQVDGKLITGQNPQSSKSVALAIIKSITQSE